MPTHLLIWIFTFVFSFSSSGQSFSDKEKIVIACTTKCTGEYSAALSRISKVTQLPIKVLDLSKATSTDLSGIDGIIIPGGVDINPSYYINEVEPELQAHTRKLNHLVDYTSSGKKRDPFEFNFLKKYFKDNKLQDLPILGICRGMQMLAVSQGIPLYVDIKTELGIRNRRNLLDRIHVTDATSLMKVLFPEADFLARKNHHQGIRVDYYLKNSVRWPNLKITAYSNDGLIAEGLEFKDRPVLGVQFHPENDFDSQGNKIFGWLMKKASVRKNARDL